MVHIRHNLFSGLLLTNTSVASFVKALTGSGSFGNCLLAEYLIRFALYARVLRQAGKT